MGHRRTNDVPQRLKPGRREGGELAQDDTEIGYGDR